MIIYKVVNKINGKIYIGQTIRDLDSRIREHKYAAFKRSHNLPFHNAVSSYGFENFDFYFVDRAINIEDLNKKEEFYINKFNSLVPNGYNAEVGGRNKSSSKETREKQSKSRKRLLANKTNHPNWGKSSGSAKTVFCFNDSKTYVSANKAALCLGLDPSAVSKVCKNIYFHTKGFRFKYL